MVKFCSLILKLITVSYLCNFQGGTRETLSPSVIIFRVCHLFPRLMEVTPDINMPSSGAFEYGCAILFPLVAGLIPLVAAECMFYITVGTDTETICAP